MSTSSIVRIACLLILGVVVLNAVDQSAASDMTKSVTITLNGNPLDGDTLTLDNNVFEFNNTGTVAAGHIPVTIGGSLEDTRANLASAISSVADYKVA